MRDTPPPPHVKKTVDGLMPVSRHAAETIGDAAMGAVFKITPTKGRSNKQLAWYWVALRMVAMGTGKWPNAAKVHEDVKRALGYVTIRTDPFTGKEIIETDSVAFSAMTHQQFTKEYMPNVKRLFLDQMGIDIEGMME